MLKIMLSISTFIFIVAIVIGAQASDDTNDLTPKAINKKHFPGEVDPHSNSGGRRIARIDNSIYVICPHGKNGEYTYRSIDNGATWKLVDKKGRFSGTLITSKNKWIYHFNKKHDAIYMTKYHPAKKSGKSKVIYRNNELTYTKTNFYHSINATTDKEGRLYVATHWGRPEKLYILRSDDEGETWTEPIDISAGLRGDYYYPIMDVTRNGYIVCVYQEFKRSPWSVHFSISKDLGRTWKRKKISAGRVANPFILPVGKDQLYLFAQSKLKKLRGLVYKFSKDNGSTWTKWRLIDTTCGYADPTAAIAENGDIYVVYRSSNGTNINRGSCGDRSRFRMVKRNKKDGQWDFLRFYKNYERTGTRNNIRYQTWHNYGGPLEWIWMQYEQNGRNRLVYYDNDLGVNILNPPTE